MSDPTNDRKIEHLKIIEEDEAVDRQKRYFDRIHLQHRALPELDRSTVDPSVTFMGKRLSFPLLISSMTGGDHELVKEINRNLAVAAETCGVALGVGSQRVMFTHPEARASFELRQHAPNTLLFANLGAVQLNYGFGIDECREAVAAVGADALYFHLNALQEAVQPEGDTNFSGLAEKIAEVARALEVPVILKEVGAGISVTDTALLRGQGIAFIDVAGTGGTSWSRIENHRRKDSSSPDLGLLFQDWGIPTPVALQQLRTANPELTLIASGGVRNGIDMVKSVILGASLCGLASPFLQPAMQSSDAVIEAIEGLRNEFSTAMFLLGMQTVEELQDNDALILQP